MTKCFFTTACFLFVTLFVFAQSKDEKNYKERAVEIQEEVWASGDKAFEVTEIPDKYKNASAVIIARTFEVTNSTKRKFKMVTIFGGTAKEYKYFTTIREKVLINDKAALEDFSTLNYKKKIDNSIKNGALKIKDISKTFIGVKVFKPSGKVININPDDEEVLTKNTDINKEGKLAIPDLQTGDILDYYIRIEEVIEFSAEVRGPDIFYLGGEYPMLYYSAKYILDRKCGADIMSMNGAKPMSETINDDDDIVLQFTEKDLPAVKASLWTNPFRQFPYHTVRYGFPGADIVAGKGTVKRGPFTDVFKANIKSRFIAQIKENMINPAPQKNMEDYFGGKKNMKDLPADSIVNYLFNYYHWFQYANFRNMKFNIEKNYNHMSWLNLAVSFSEILRDYDIDNDIVIVPDRFKKRLKEIFSIWDFETMVKINSNGKIKWVCFNDFFQNPGVLAPKYQGEEALLLTREGKSKNPKYADAEMPLRLPVSTSTENVIAEILKVQFNKDDLQKITIERSVKHTGNLKNNSQKKLILVEDVEADFAAIIKKKRVTEYIAESGKDGKILAEEIRTALDNERTKQKDYFKDEITEQYIQAPTELISYKITNNGFTIDKPAFEFTETFTMKNFVKKANNNFIFEVGRLMGSYQKVEEKERTRTLDIYMPSARTLTYTFAVSLPEGYTVKGVEELNKKVENDIAAFISTAKVDGNTLAVTITRIYNNSFEPASNWPKLLMVMDAAADFTNTKLLLEKKK